MKVHFRFRKYEGLEFLVESAIYPDRQAEFDQELGPSLSALNLFQSQWIDHNIIFLLHRLFVVEIERLADVPSYPTGVVFL
jgi:hypothetical protein